MLKNQFLALLMLGFRMEMGMAPELRPDVWRGSGKSFKSLIFLFLTTSLLMKCSLKAVSGVADVGDPHGGEDSPRTPAPGSGSKIRACHVDQHRKRKGLDV